MVRNKLNLEHQRDDEDISGRQKNGLVLCRLHGRLAGLRAGRALAGISFMGHGVVDRRDWRRPGSCYGGAFALTCRTFVDGASFKLEIDSAGLREKNWRGSLTASVLEGIGWPGSLIFSSRNIESPDGAERGFVEKGKPKKKTGRRSTERLTLAPLKFDDAFRA